jgi:Uma2 family endonuclease
MKPPPIGPNLPNHLQLPDTDGAIVENFQEHPQGSLLTDSILPILRRRHPDGRFCIGHDSGIYWRMTDPPLDGAKAPDWFYVPDVPAMLAGEFRRSYVMWQELMPPLIILEIVSGDGTEERDQTPMKGKFWVYERVIRPAFYGIFDPSLRTVEVHHLLEGRFQRLHENERGHYPIAPLGVELGIWQGRFQNMEMAWLRWWDAQGNLLLHSEESLEQERQRTERLAARLRELGIDPDSL